MSTCTPTNRLLRAKTFNARDEAFEANPTALTSDGGYFFGLLERMQKDVKGQKTGPNQKNLVNQLAAIEKEAKARRDTLLQ